MAAKKPSVALLALGKLSKKPPPGEGGSDSDGLEMAMEDLISAIQAGDAKGAAEAFRSAADMCSGGGDDY